MLRPRPTKLIFGWLPALLGLALVASVMGAVDQETPEMFYGDTSRLGRPFAKDPSVVRFKGRYLMYHSLPPAKGDGKPNGWTAGIAESPDLVHWTKVGEVLPQHDYESNGLAAPDAIVLDGKVHLFYQTYGNRSRNAICHAVSDDGVHFERNESNPIFRPEGEWTVGRAIDAEPFAHDGRLLLYWATRDPSMKIQMLGVAGAPLDGDYSRDEWTQLCDGPILKPTLPWEKRCTEAATLCEHDGWLYMFYAGGYNNDPQQVGCAVSRDGVEWQRLSQKPLLPNGPPDSWNSSESGHPDVFIDRDGRGYLFFQGNDDNGHTWHLSKMHLRFDGRLPYLVRPRDGKEFHLQDPTFPGQ